MLGHVSAQRLREMQPDRAQAGLSGELSTPSGGKTDMCCFGSLRPPGVLQGQVLAELRVPWWPGV